MSIICIQSINEKKNHIRYEVDTDSQPLGVGGMGSVYRGKRIQEKTGVCVDVAIKFCLTICLHTSSKEHGEKLPFRFIMRIWWKCLVLSR